MNTNRRPHLLAALLLFLPLAPHAAASDLTAESRKVLVEKVCAEIDRLYPHEEIGRETREGILENLRAGRYDTVTSPASFASRVTADMEDLSRDKHLDLYFDPVRAAEVAAREASGDGQAGPVPGEVESARWENFGFRELRFLDGRIGYLDLRMFFAARHAGSTAVAAMDFLSGAHAVIVDLRRNGGGWDDMVTLLASYFIDLQEPEVLAISQSTLDESYHASIVTAYVPGRKLTGIPVYILTSSSTASAAEAFTSILKHKNENVVVVGQTTAGAENPVEYVALDDEFVLKIPCYKRVYFGTRSGWEGKGVAADVEASDDRALETAHLLALRTLQERFTDETSKEKLRWGIDGLRAVVEPAPVDRSVLESYAGPYRDVRIFLEGDDLFLRFDDRPARRLLAVSADYFVLEGRNDLRVRFVLADGKVTALERIYSDGYRALHARR